MSRAKFTPGPWTVAGHGSRFDESRKFEFGIDTPAGQLIIDAYRLPEHNMEATIGLIAAAPEMYAVLQKLIEWNREYPSNQDYHSIGEIVKIGDLCNAICKNAEWVLKKARGEG